MKVNYYLDKGLHCTLLFPHSLLGMSFPRTAQGDWCRFSFSPARLLHMSQDNRSTHSSQTNCHQLTIQSLT